MKKINKKQNKVESGEWRVESSRILVFALTYILLSTFYIPSAFAEDATSTESTSSTVSTASSTPEPTPTQTATSTVEFPLGTSTQSISTSPTGSAGQATTSSTSPTGSAGQASESSASAGSTASTVSTIIDDAINAVKKIFDTSPPDSINDLRIISISPRRITIGWTTPFDDSGKIGSYEARISRNPLSDLNWNDAIQISGTPDGGKTGDKVIMEIYDLPEDADIYVAVKAIDAVGKSSNPAFINAKTKVNSFRSDSARSASTGVNGSAKVNEMNSAAREAENIALEYGNVSATIVLPSGLPSAFPIFVNFINTSSGLSYGGPTVNGLASYRIPAGDYYVRLVVTDTEYKEPANPPTFKLEANEEKNLGSIQLVSKDSKEKTDALLAEAQKQGGVAKMLVAIISLLTEVLDTLQKIAYKLNVEQ